MRRNKQFLYPGKAIAFEPDSHSSSTPIMSSNKASAMNTKEMIPANFILGVPL